MLGVNPIRVEQKLPIRSTTNILDSNHILLCVFVLVFISALSLIYLKYQNRERIIEYNTLRSESSMLVQEGDRLTLENAAWSNHNVVVEYARASGMHKPKGKEIVVLKKDHK